MIKATYERKCLLGLEFLRCGVHDRLSGECGRGRQGTGGVAENSHREMTTIRQREAENGSAFEASKLNSSNTFSNTATPLSLPGTVLIQITISYLFIFIF